MKAEKTFSSTMKRVNIFNRSSVMENMVITTPTLTRRQRKELTKGAANFMKMWCKPLIKMKAVGSVGEHVQKFS